MRVLSTAAVLLMFCCSVAAAEQAGRAGFERVRLVDRAAAPSRSWGRVVDQLKSLAHDRPLRDALLANHGSIVLGQGLVVDKKYPGVSTLKQLVLTGNGLVVRSRIGNHADTGNGEALFSPLPNPHYKGSKAVRFSRFGIPFFTERLQPGEWAHLDPKAIRAAATEYRFSSAIEEAKHMLATDPR